MNVTGASTSAAAMRVRRSNASSGGVSSNSVRRTAFSRRISPTPAAASTPVSLFGSVDI
jgi:hypothetical protein